MIDLQPHLPTDKCGDVVSASPWHRSLMKSQVPPVSSDKLLLDATIVFGIVSDIVLALIINCSNYFGPYPSFWKQCMEQEKPGCTHAHRGPQYVGALV